MWEEIGLKVITLSLLLVGYAKCQKWPNEPGIMIPRMRMDLALVASLQSTQQMQVCSLHYCNLKFQLRPDENEHDLQGQGEISDIIFELNGIDLLRDQFQVLLPIRTCWP